MADRTAYIIVDLGYGDAGKGSLVEALTSRTGAKLNVRFNGGGQAAHNVVLPDGRHHTFAQFGSGMLDPSVTTYLSRHFLWNPIAMRTEAEVLDGAIDAFSSSHKPDLDVMSRTFVDEGALVVTPWHQAINRLREFSRKDARHGSCGVGIGEAVSGSLFKPNLSLRAGDLRNWTMEKLRWHLEEVAEHSLTIWFQVLRDHCMGHDFPLHLHQDRDFLFTKKSPPNCAALFNQIAGNLHMVDGAAEQAKLFEGEEDVVFEGAQGILIDEKYGFAPHNTWSTCTSRNARQILKDIGWEGQTKVIGALRAYAVRHGTGPFVSEDNHAEFSDEHNSFNDWQREFRTGWFDAVAAYYAMRAEWQSAFEFSGYSSAPGIHSLAITSLDRLEKLLQKGISWKICTGYEWNGGGPLVFEPGCFGSQGHMTGALRQAKPVYGRQGNTLEDLLVAIETLLHCPIEILSEGPTKDGKAWIGSMTESKRCQHGLASQSEQGG